MKSLAFLWTTAFTLAITVASSLFTPLLHAEEEASCDLILNGDSISPQLFQKGVRNKLLLWWNQKQMYQIHDIPVRRQCFGTCYLYATQTVLETTLRSQGVMKPGEYLTNLMPLMNIAYERSSFARKQFTLPALISNGWFIQSLPLGQVGFILDEKSVKVLGGVDVISKIEREIIDDFRKGKGPWWMFWDRGLDVNAVIQLRGSDFVKEIKTIFEERLKKISKNINPIRVIKFGDIRGEEVRRYEVESANTKYSLFYPWSGWFSKYNHTRISKAGFKSASEIVFNNNQSGYSFRLRVLPQILTSLSERRAVQVSVQKLFGRSSGAHSHHSIALVGVAIDGKTKEVKGFKYVNSWSTSYGQRGFGYISVQQLEEHLTGVGLIDEIQVTEE